MNIDPSFHRHAIVRLKAVILFFFLFSGLLRSFLGWTFRAFSGCSACSSCSLTAEVTLAVTVEMISPVFEVKLVSAG